VARARDAHAARALHLTASAAMVDDGGMPFASGEPR
jgi:hypothetical protein